MMPVCAPILKNIWCNQILNIFVAKSRIATLKPLDLLSLEEIMAKIMLLIEVTHLSLPLYLRVGFNVINFKSH